MFPRSPSFIYKPYCFASLKIQHTPGGSWTGKKFFSTCSTSEVKHNQRYPDVQNGPGIVPFNLMSPKITGFDAAKFIEELRTRDHNTINVNAIEYSSLLTMYPYFGCPLIASRTNSNINIKLRHQSRSGFVLNSDQTFINSSMLKCNGTKEYNKKLEEVQLLSNPLSPADKKESIHKETNKDKNLSNELPSEQQLDDMMCYFQEQAPKLFSSTGWSYNKCSYKITFENMMIGTKSETLNAYILQINIMKNATKLLLSNPELSIMRMTKDIENGSLQIRWQVQGVPRYLQPFSILGVVDEKSSIRYIDGFSVFYVKNDGLYHRHTLLKMTPLRNDSQRTSYSQMFPGLFGIYRPPLRPSLEANIPNSQNCVEKSRK